jgi:adenosylcobinamide-GDP ribazoletransferase
VAVPIPRSLAVTAGAYAQVAATVRAALGLLTRLPVRPTDGTASGAAAFPLAGALVGLAGVVPVVIWAASEPMLGSLLAVAATTALTGALHLDGLADTADALLAPDPTQAERARKDPAIGSGGTVALILVVGIQVVALAGLASSAGGPVAGAAFVAAAVVARALPVIAVVLARSRVERAGFGGWFAARVRPADAVVALSLATVLIVGLAVIVGSLIVVLGGLIGAVVGLALAGLIVRGRGQLDGDGLGAIVELTVAATLAAVAFAA